MAKWLDKYEQGGLVLKQKTKDNYGVRENPNDVETYLPPGFVGMGNDISGRNYSPAWGGQFAMGGSVPGSVGFTYARTINPAPSEGPYAKKTMPSAQTGMMLVPSEQQLPVAAGTLEAMGEGLSAPQKAATYLASGKYQTPSEAMGIENPYGAFAADFLLDPVNFIGAGFSKGLVKKGAKDIGELISKKRFKSEINWGNWNKEIPENSQLMKEYRTIEQAAKDNGSWMKYDKKVLDEEKTLNNKKLFDEQEKEFNLKNTQEEEVRRSLYEAEKAKIDIEETNKLLDSNFQDYFDNASAQWKRNFENYPESKLEFLDVKGVNRKEIDNALEPSSLNIKNREADLLTKYESVPINKFDRTNESVYTTSIEDFPGTPEQFVQSNSENFKKAYPEGWETVWRGGDRNPELNTKYIKDGEVIFTTKDEYGANVYNKSQDPYVKLKEGETPEQGLTKLYAPATENKIVIDGEHAYTYDGRKILGQRRNYARLNALDQTPSTLLQQENLNSFKNWMRKNHPETDLSDRTMTDHFASFLNSPEGRNIDRVEFKKIYDGTIEPIDVEVHNLNNRKQLKSMWGNNGMFDMTNPNIYKALIPGALGVGALQQKEDGGEIPSAQNGEEMKYWQEGLDWKPRTISQNGSIFGKYKETGNFPKENIDAQEVYNRINPGLSYWQLPLAQAMGDMVNKPRPEDNQATPEEEAYWKRYLHLPTSIPKSSYRLPEDEAKGNEYVGMFPSMDRRIQAIGDTLNTGKIYRNYDKYKAQHPDLIDKSKIEDAYNFGKKLLNNPNEWQQADEDLTVKGTSRKTTGLGALQDFGMMWDKPHNKINVHDTYDFPWYTKSAVPERTKALQIRSSVDFDPTEGSWMLRNNLQNYSNTDKYENGGWLDNFKDGGDITKDNDGYWNPDNWGKPVEIGSNDITMQGVNQPLLGISDTGDTQYMVPGKDYKFKGKKVREYPVAQNGLRQEQKSLQNLDNLTNFTNYNTPQKGGWLQKYSK